MDIRINPSDDQPSRRFQPGDRVVLVRTTDPWTRLVPGVRGTVTGRDDQMGQIHIAWDDGSRLSMLPGEGDEIRLVDKPQKGGVRNPGARRPPMRVPQSGSCTRRGYRRRPTRRSSECSARLAWTTAAGLPATARTRSAPRRRTARDSGQRGTPRIRCRSTTSSPTLGKPGTDAGKTAASWLFDGTTPDESYRHVMRGIDEGDPLILGTCQPPSLAPGGDYTETGLAGDLGIEPGDPALPDADDRLARRRQRCLLHQAGRIAREHLDRLTREPFGRRSKSKAEHDAKRLEPQGAGIKPSLAALFLFVQVS